MRSAVIRSAPGVASLSAAAPLRLLRPLLAASLLALLWLWPQSASAKDAKFRITATWIVNYTEPKPQSVMTRRNYFVTLKGNGSIDEQVELYVGNKFPGSSLTSRETALGVAGGPAKSTLWKVVNDTTLVRLFGNASYTFVIWLRTQGDNSCTATLEWRLSPGFTSYERRNRLDKVTAKFSEPSWAYARCDVL